MPRKRTDRIVVGDEWSRQDVMHLARVALEHRGLCVRSGVVTEGVVLDLAVLDEVTHEVLVAVKVHRDASEACRWVGTPQHAAYKLLPVAFERFRTHREDRDAGFVDRVVAKARRRVEVRWPLRGT